MNNYVFVYGTLKQGFFNHRLLKGAKPIIQGVSRCSWGGPILASRTTTTTTPVVEETTTESVYTPPTWPGLDYGPGPLTIINPYCPPKPEGTEL
jgi:hypothetical protein